MRMGQVVTVTDDKFSARARCVSATRGSDALFVGAGLSRDWLERLSVPRAITPLPSFSGRGAGVDCQVRRRHFVSQFR